MHFLERIIGVKHTGRRFGEVRADKSVDFRARMFKRIGASPKEFLDEVLAVIDACLYPKLEPDVPFNV